MTKKTHKPVTVGFIALGCPKNLVDSERMLAQIAEAGLLIAAEPERADIVIINTCGFIAPAKEESLGAIRQAVEAKRKGRVRKVIVAGCLSQRDGAELLGEVQGIDAIVGLEQRDAIVQIIRDTLAAAKPSVYLGPVPCAVADDRTRLRIGPAHSAYLRISEGCNHRCSFCTIPAIRGPYRSKPVPLILDEARELVSSGAVELNLIGQDTTVYGRDLKMQDGLVSLLAQMEQIPELAWIRILYAYPTGITDALIETIARSEKIVHYLDIPIQHASDTILKAMRRPDTHRRLRDLVERLRAAIPDIVLRTTLIVGFPGETQKEFEDLVEFVKWARFDALGVFTFYPESGTPAARFPDQVPEEIKRDRLEELMLTQQEIAFARNNQRIGSQLLCLIDSIEGRDTARGRFYGQAPDIDSVCIISRRFSVSKASRLRIAGGTPATRSPKVTPGQFVQAKVTGTQDYDLLAEQI
jgi:ribosomal protein S12 methylthiotransferase